METIVTSAQMKLLSITVYVFVSSKATVTATIKVPRMSSKHQSR